MKYLKKYEELNEINIEETEPVFYTKHYEDDETFTGTARIRKGEFKYNKYTGKEFRELFMFWYNKIKPYLDKNDKHGAADILSDWDEECLAKFDLYILLKKHFDIQKIIGKYNL